MTADLVPDCYSCGYQGMAQIPPREDVVHTEHWRAAVAFNSTLPGWLVVVPTRHVTSYAELSEEAAAELGGLLHRLSRALEEVTGCVKTYLMQFAEAEGYSHLHVHVVPRAADHPAEARGPAVFSFLAADEADWFTPPQRDALALRIRDALPRKTLTVW